MSREDLVEDFEQVFSGPLSPQSHDVVQNLDFTYHGSFRRERDAIVKCLVS